MEASRGGVELPTVAAGLTRTSVNDNGAGDRDIYVQYKSVDASVEATLFLFHAAEPAVALWYDRAETAMLARTIFKRATPIEPAPVAFAAPGSGITSSLRRGFLVDGEWRTSTLAVVPVGEWLAVVRISGKAADAAALAARLDRFVTDIRWPTQATPGPAAAPMAACTTNLDIGRARPAKPTMQEAVAGSLLAGVMLSQGGTAPAATVPWCRDRAGTPLYAAYRRAGGDGYLLALGDSGRVVDVFKGLKIKDVFGAGYRVIMRDLDGSASTYPLFDALPSPATVAELVLRTPALARVSMNGGKQQVTINSGALK